MHFRRQLISYLMMCFFFVSGASWAANTHGTPDPAREQQAWFGDGFAPYIVSGCAPVVPGSGLSLAAFACNGYVEASGVAYYVTQPAAAVTVPNSATVWLALHRNLSDTVSGCGGGNWVRVSGTHYLTCANATQPAQPTGGTFFARVTVVAGSINAVFDLRRLIPQEIWHPFDVRLFGAIPNDGLDDSAAFQAAVNAANEEFGGAIETTRNIRGLVEIFVPAGTFDLDSMVTMTVSLRCAGRQYSQIRGAGIVLLRWDTQSHFHIRDCMFRTETNGAITTHMHILNSVYFEIKDVTSSAGPSGFTTNRTKGIHVEATNAALTPPRGSGSIENYVYSSVPLAGTSPYHAIHLQNNGAAVENVIIHGMFNIEEAWSGVAFDGAARSAVIGKGTIGGNNVNLRFLSGASNLVIGPRLTSPIVEHVNIDAASSDNILIALDFFTPATLGTNSGSRTIFLHSGDGNNLSRQADTRFSSSTSTAGQSGTIELQTDPTYNHHGLLIYRDTLPTGNAAQLKIERGTDVTRQLVAVDIAGVNKVNVDQNGDLSLGASVILVLGSVVNASLGAPVNGSIRFCTDCTIANPCAGGGTGAIAKRLNGVWVCN